MKKILVLGVVVLFLTFGLVLMGCKDNNCPGDGDCRFTNLDSWCDNDCVTVFRWKCRC